MRVKQSTFTKTNPKLFWNKGARARCAGPGSAIAIQKKYEAGDKKYEVKNENWSIAVNIIYLYIIVTHVETRRVFLNMLNRQVKTNSIKSRHVQVFPKQRLPLDSGSWILLWRFVSGRIGQRYDLDTEPPSAHQPFCSYNHGRSATAYRKTHTFIGRPFQNIYKIMFNKIK